MPYGEGNGLHRRRQSLARSHGTTLSARSPPHAGDALASRLDRRHHSRLPDLVADRTSPSLFHTWEQTHELLEPPGSLAEQDGANEGPNGASRLRLRPALQRQPRLRRIPVRDAAAPRRGATGVQGFPRPPASRQGQGRVRRVHEGAPRPADAAERPAASELTVRAFAFRPDAPNLLTA